MWHNIVKENPLYTPIANITRAAFLIKDIFGYDTKPDQQSYKDLRDVVERDYDLGKMSFYN